MLFPVLDTTRTKTRQVTLLTLEGLRMVSDRQIVFLGYDPASVTQQLARVDRAFVLLQQAEFEDRRDEEG